MSRKELRVIHFSDTHITPRQQFMRDSFHAGMNIINSLEHDFAIFTGDLTQAGLAQDYQLAIDLKQKFKSDPIYWIIGNHDSKNGGFEVWEQLVGPRQFYKLTDDYLFIGLDSCVPDKDEGRFGREALDYTKILLSKYGEDRTKIVSCHHHLLPIPKTGRERSNAIDAGDMLAVLLDYGVDALFTGHKHHPNVYKVEDLILISAGTLSSYKTRSGGPRVFNYVKIVPNKEIKVKTIDVDGHVVLKDVKGISKRFRMVNASGGKWIRIVQVAGTEFGTTKGFLKEKFKRGMTLIEQTEPDLLIHCGNLTKNGRILDYERGLAALSKYSNSFVFTPGPSDIQGYGESILNQYFNFESQISMENVCISVLNTSSPETELGVVGRTSRNRLIRHMYSNHSKKNLFDIILMHHHIIPIPGTRETSSLEDSGDVLRMIVDSEVNLVLTGHLGKSFCTRVEKTVFANCNNMVSEKRASMENSFNIIDISKEGAIVVSEVEIPSAFRKILGIFPSNKKINLPQLTRKTI